jgi:hypothetical protein
MVILNLVDNNPIVAANEATFKANIAEYNSELALVLSKEYLIDSSFNPDTFNAVVWDGTGDEISDWTGTIKEYITSITKDDGTKFEIQSGKLVYVGNNTVEKGYITSIGLTYGSELEHTPPTVVFGTNGAGNLQVASTTVTVSDIGSGINASTLQYVWDTQNSTTPSSGWIAFTSGDTLTKTGEGTYYLWIKAADNFRNSVVAKSNVFTIIPPSGETYSGTTTGFAYNNPIIPTGFTTVNTTDASWSSLSTDWDKGLVIQDASGNQFVWVPVDGTNVQYAKWCIIGKPYNDPSISDDTLPTGVTSESYQITTYGGFYIARYESMFDYNSGSIRAASKKSTNKTGSTNWSTTRTSTYNGYLWNCINYTDARSYSEAMSTAYGYTTVKTGLATGTQWDTVSKWIQNSGTLVTDSRAWGNYQDSISPANISGYKNLQVSGYSECWKAKNIYDMAGNASEWINEKYDSYRVDRGGNNNSTGSGAPVAHREYKSTDYVGYFSANGYNNHIAFRVVLYIL